MTELRGVVYTKDCVFVPGKIIIDDGLILDVQKLEMAELTAQERGQYLIPGLVDVHFHGAAGYDFCDGTKEALRAIETYENRNGITTICPATMTLPVSKLERIISNIAESQSLRGIHLEGPFIAEKKKGAQKEEYIISADAEVLCGLQAKANGLIKLVTIAPEIDGAMECIEELRSEFHFSIGHTMADYETACKAFEAGADHVTHLYNAMPIGTHRKPSVPEAAADYDNVFVELICDGVHIHPSVIRNAFRIYGDDRIVFISDSMRATGMEEGNYTLGGQNVSVKNSLATLDDGTIAGSVTNLYDCMKNAISMDIPKESAIKAVTINPAKSIGTDGEVGSIESGKRADILILDENFRLEKVIIGGKIYK